VFGPVVTLQNVAVISWMQKTPVVAATVGVDWTGGPPNCCKAAKLLSKDEARRIVSNIAKLPETPNVNRRNSDLRDRLATLLA
jgi:hypothetical protein